MARRATHEPGPLRVRGLWPHRERRPQRGKEHPGHGPAAHRCECGLGRRNPAWRTPGEYPRTLRGIDACEGARELQRAAAPKAALSGSRKVGRRKSTGRTSVGRNHLGTEPPRESPSIALSAWVERMSNRRNRTRRRAEGSPPVQSNCQRLDSKALTAASAGPADGRAGRADHECRRSHRRASHPPHWEAARPGRRIGAEISASGGPCALHGPRCCHSITGAAMSRPAVPYIFRPGRHS